MVPDSDRGESIVTGRRSSSSLSRGLAIAILFASAVSAGAARTHDAPIRNAARDGADRVASNLGISTCTRKLLSRHGLLCVAAIDPELGALRLETALASRPKSEPGAALALAELWYRVALRQRPNDPDAAAPPLRAAAAAAALALGETGLECCDRVIAIHNDAVARLVRMSQDEGISRCRSAKSSLGVLGVLATASDRFVDPGRFAEIVVADDLRVTGLRHHFRTSGLGVPVVGTRCVDRGHPTDRDEVFYPPKLRIPATALAAPCGGIAGAAYRCAPLRLVFHDAFSIASLRLGAGETPLATDRSTHLAMLASQERFSAQAIQGVLAGEFTPEVEPGLFMFRPYAPGKIPVVFVHGLAATPLGFLQALNDFQNDPALSARYQFCVFLYPTGRPIVRSALWLRQELERARTVYGNDPAFHRMVLVGHSLGGVLTHMAASESGRDVWDGTLNLPPEALRVAPGTRAKIDELLFFHPLPYVRRLVFIATPHRGSPLARSLVGRYFTGRIRESPEQAALVAEIKAWNGPAVIRDEAFGSASINAISNLRIDSPLLQAVGRLPVAPGIQYHTIAFRFAGHASHDLVVPLWSAHLDGARSESILAGRHGSEQSPGALAEVRRILLEHMNAP